MLFSVAFTFLLFDSLNRFSSRGRFYSRAKEICSHLSEHAHVASPPPAPSRCRRWARSRAGAVTQRSERPRGLRSFLRLSEQGGNCTESRSSPERLVLLRALAVCARLVSSGNRRSLKCQRGGLTNSAGINFYEYMFLRKTAKLKKKKIKSSCLGFLSAAVHNG